MRKKKNTNPLGEFVVVYWWDACGKTATELNDITAKGLTQNRTIGLYGGEYKCPRSGLKYLVITHEENEEDKHNDYTLIPKYAVRDILTEKGEREW